MRKDKQKCGGCGETENISNCEKCFHCKCGWMECCADLYVRPVIEPGVVQEIVAPLATVEEVR